MIIAIISFSAAAAAFLLLAGVLLSGRDHPPQKKLLVFAAVTSSVWAGVVAVQSATGGLVEIAQLLELSRAFAWFAFLLVMLNSLYYSTDKVSGRFRIAFAGIAAFTLGLMLLVLYRISGGSVLAPIAGNDVLAGYLLISVGGLVIVEQLFHNTAKDNRRALKYLYMAVGGMYAYDFYMYSHALLFQRIDAGLWDARGFIHAMVVPVIGIALSRSVSWSPNRNVTTLAVSRRIVFHTTALVGTGIYLLAMGVGGYYIRAHGGSWGLVAQATFIFGAVLVLTILMFSGQLRARLRVLINKNFFRYKYDYRDEWLRFTRTLSSTTGEAPIYTRAIGAIAQIIESQGGMLWLNVGDSAGQSANGTGGSGGYFTPVACWNMTVISEREPCRSGFSRFLLENEWVVNIDEHRGSAGKSHQNRNEINMPAWLFTIPNAWLVVPLILHDQLLGFVVLARSNSHTRIFNWEDSDLLKTAARQAASHLGQHQASQALAEARRFEEFNRLSAFVVHDLKSLVAQLSLVATNAARHRENPAFFDDAMMTVESSVQKMNRLLQRLKDGIAQDRPTRIELAGLVGEVVESWRKGDSRPVPELEHVTAGLVVSADRDRLIAVLGHVIQNAQDATPRNGYIKLRVEKSDAEGAALIDIEDSGCGMDEAFIRARLFRPFETTKGPAGMGIGVFQVREYVESLGGKIIVHSVPGRGTRFRIHIPCTTVQSDIQYNQYVS